MPGDYQVSKWRLSNMKSHWVVLGVVINNPRRILTETADLEPQPRPRYSPHRRLVGCSWMRQWKEGLANPKSNRNLDSYDNGRNQISDDNWRNQIFWKIGISDFSLSILHGFTAKWHESMMVYDCHIAIQTSTPNNGYNITSMIKHSLQNKYHII